MLHYSGFMPALRRDALRNRERILDAARVLRSDGDALLLNAVAHRAGVGVGTVYRHFPSIEALTEALVEHRFVEMTEAAKEAADSTSEFVAIRRFIAQSLQTFIDDPDFARAVVSSTAVREETRALRADLFDAFSGLIGRSAQHFRSDLEPADIMILLCGLGYSARLRPERSAHYLDALFEGILAR
ncbi:TetR family transcriptional regulator [Microbacterium murale]|uniref:TetR family transcriptional regulator n=2 Tax=Microbacterium murale TaxID=1081040 RepID=A0ABQ1RZ79_9MICO|nr:TetR family transcriptional regulator [Microbacterium murale]